jgi:hypothetical protein
MRRNCQFFALREAEASYVPLSGGVITAAPRTVRAEEHPLAVALDRANGARAQSEKTHCDRAKSPNLSQAVGNPKRSCIRENPRRRK